MSANHLCEDAGVFRAVTHFFSRGYGSDDGLFHPTESALSRWGNDSLNGPAVVGLAARCLELEYGAGRVPAHPTDGRPVQGGPPGSDRGADPAGSRRPANPQLRMRCPAGRDRRRARDDGRLPAVRAAARAGNGWRRTVIHRRRAGWPGTAYLIGSDDAGWSQAGTEHQNTSRKRVYHRTIDVVEGEQASPFVRTVVAAEATSLVTNLGTRGIGYINGDLTVGLSRLPAGGLRWRAGGFALVRRRHRGRRRHPVRRRGPVRDRDGDRHRQPRRPDRLRHSGSEAHAGGLRDNQES